MFSRLRNRAADDRGFTLMELLITIIIIGILVAVSVPIYLNQRQKAADSVVKSDLRGAAVVAEIYATENDDAYAGISQANLATIEPTIASLTFTTLAATPPACATTACVGYTMSMTSTTTGIFTFANTGTTVTRSCSGGTAGCNGTSW